MSPCSRPSSGIPTLSEWNLSCLFGPQGLPWICPSAVLSHFPNTPCAPDLVSSLFLRHATPAPSLGPWHGLFPGFGRLPSNCSAQLHSGQLSGVAFSLHCDLGSLPPLMNPLPLPVCPPGYLISRWLICNPFCSLLVSPLRTRILLPVISLMSPVPQLVSGPCLNEWVSSFWTVSRNKCEVKQKTHIRSA